MKNSRGLTGIKHSSFVEGGTNFFRFLGGIGVKRAKMGWLKSSPNKKKRIIIKNIQAKNKGLRIIFYGGDGFMNFFVKLDTGQNVSWLIRKIKEKYHGYEIVNRTMSSSPREDNINFLKEMRDKVKNDFYF